MSVRILTISLLLFVVSTGLQAQKRSKATFYDQQGNEVQRLDDAHTFVVFKGYGKKRKVKTGCESTYLKDSTLVRYQEFEKGKPLGHSFTYDPEKGITVRGNMQDAGKVGNWYTTDSQSNIIKVDIFDNQGKAVVSTDLAASGNTIYRATDLPAQFPGGNAAWGNHLKKTLRYPLEAMKNGIAGVVTVEFYTAKDGSIMDIFVISSPHPMLSMEAARVVRLGGKWEPAIRNNQHVNGMHELTINFNVRSNNSRDGIFPIPRTPYPELRGN